MLLINSKECEEFLRANWEIGTMRMQESVYAVYLNHEGHRIFTERLAFGRFSKCDPDIYLMMQYAKAVHSNYIVLSHNHPCGDPAPSEGDKAFTSDVQFALALCDIVLIDHIILTHSSYFSFKDGGLLPDIKYKKVV